MSRIYKNKKNPYLDKVFGYEDSFLKRIRKAAQKEGVERMQISAHEGRILQLLVQISKAKKVVEIGTLYAYSTLHIARALPKGGRVFTLDIASERHRKSQQILKQSKDYGKIRWISGPALEGLKSIEKSAPFDMVFIDADKESYMEYLSWAEKHLQPGGLAVADNTFLFGAVYGNPDFRSPKKKTIETMKKFNKRISHSVCWEGALIPTEEGLSVGIKKV